MENGYIAQQPGEDQTDRQHDDIGWETVKNKNAKHPRSVRKGNREE